RPSPESFCRQAEGSRSRRGLALRDKHARKFEPDRHFAAGTNFGVEKVRFTEPLAQYNFDFNRIAPSHDLLEANVVHASDHGHLRRRISRLCRLVTVSPGIILACK